MNKNDCLRRDGYKISKPTSTNGGKYDTNKELEKIEIKLQNLLNIFKIN